MISRQALGTQFSLFKVLCIASIGSGLEMYDFVIYIFFAHWLAEQFFPSTSYFASLLLVFGVFAVGFFCRFIGAIIFGHLGDTRGRKKTLIYTITLMAFPMIVISCLPTYNQIGVLAPIILTLMRCLQGLAVGGEFSGSITLAAEYAPTSQRGYACSWIVLSLNAGVLLASLMAMLITKYVTDEHHYWGWRIAFFFGCILAVIIGVMRRHLAETPLFTQLFTQKQAIQQPIFKIFTDEAKITILLIFSMIGPALTVGMIMFLPTYLESFSLMNQPVMVFVNNTIFLLILCLLIPVWGKLSDRIGRKPILGLGLASIVVFIYPVARLLSTAHTYFTIFWALLSFAVMISLVLSVFGSFLAENFPTRFRATSVGLAYNIPFAVITGTFPMISLAIIKHTHSLNYQYSYIIVLALIAFIFVMLTKETVSTHLV